jgi:hypothetical protein
MPPAGGPTRAAGPLRPERGLAPHVGTCHVRDLKTSPPRRGGLERLTTLQPVGDAPRDLRLGSPAHVRMRFGVRPPTEARELADAAGYRAAADLRLGGASERRYESLSSSVSGLEHRAPVLRAATGEPGVHRSPPSASRSRCCAARRRHRAHPRPRRPRAWSSRGSRGGATSTAPRATWAVRALSGRLLPEDPGVARGRDGGAIREAFRKGRAGLIATARSPMARSAPRVRWARQHGRS